MSKKKNKIAPKLSEVVRAAENVVQSEAAETSQMDSKASRWQNLLSYIKANALMVGIIVFVALGVLGAGLKYLDDDAQRELARRANTKGNLNNQDQSFLNKINPFLSPPDPTPTPQLSKSYIYSGSRLLAVEDANANAAPPADLAVWRPSSGVWWVLGGTGSQQFSSGWGTDGDDPVEGDSDLDKELYLFGRPIAFDHFAEWNKQRIHRI